MDKYQNNQTKEIESVKPRSYSLKLSDADVERIAYKAAGYNLTVAELLESFIGDLVNGTYTNGSDEIMYANQWAERCWFAHEPEPNLINFLGNSGLSAYDWKEFLDILEQIDAFKEDIRDDEKELQKPKENWTDIITYNQEKKNFEPSYASLEEYMEALRSELECAKECLEYAEKELDDFKREFSQYMGKREYTWDDELKKFQAWYKENVSDKLETTFTGQIDEEPVSQTQMKNKSGFEQQGDTPCNDRQHRKVR